MNSRRSFLRHTSILATGLAAGCKTYSRLPTPNSRLAFSTLGCPDWSLEEAARFAAANGYSGLEIRGLRRCMHLPDCPEFRDAAARRSSRELMRRHGLQFINLGSSVNLHLTGAERDKTLNEGRAYIDLAAEIGCPYIRVFPNNYPAGESRAAVHARIAEGLKILGDHARGKGVTVLMETHGDVVAGADLKSIMEAADHPAAGLVWDPTNMWVVTRESPAAAYALLRPWIKHVHVKDARLVDGKPVYTEVGSGEVPIREAVQALMADGYKGYYSFEWEKLWHPQLPDGATVFPQFPRWMKTLR